MNKIIAPITPCGNVGFDEFNQLLLRRVSKDFDSHTFVADTRRKTCAICGKGWELTAEAIADQIAINPTVSLLVHNRCMNGYHSMRERYRIDKLLSDREWLREGPIGFVMEEMPNQYKGAWDTPWFKMEFRKALPGVELVIGRRKRVWHVELRNLTKERCKAVINALEAVTDTKGADANSVHVHCWNEQQLTERVKLMMEAVLAVQPEMDVNGR